MLNVDYKKWGRVSKIETDMVDARQQTTLSVDPDRHCNHGIVLDLNLVYVRFAK